MVEKKECERLGLRVKKRKNGENHDTVETGAKRPVRRTGQRVIRRVWIAFTADLMPA